jgi:hypothetical protein
VNCANGSGKGKGQKRKANRKGLPVSPLPKAELIFKMHKKKVFMEDLFLF